MNDSVDINPNASIPAHRATFILDRPFVLTTDKTLVLGMPYMLIEGNRTKAVRLLNIEIFEGIADLLVQELNSPKTFTLSWNLDYAGEYWLWSLADLPSLMELSS